ncbi:hypothetical protein ACNKHP_21495 [Shigella boydii]
MSRRSYDRAELPGVITPGECKIGIRPGHIHKPGKVGIVARSGTLTYEAVKQPRIPVSVSRPVWVLAVTQSRALTLSTSRNVRKNPQTEAIVMMGEIGGSAEEEAAAYIKEHVTKPVVGYIAGVTAQRQTYGPRGCHHCRWERDCG